MFRRSGPGHMLLLTVQNKIVQDQISLSLAKVKVKFGTKGQRKGKKLNPSGATQIPPNTSLYSIVLESPPCPVKTPPWPSPPEPVDQSCLVVLIWWWRPGSRTPPPW